MRKLTKAQLETLAQRALAMGNPYIKKAVAFQIDGEDRYITTWCKRGESLSRTEVDAGYLETATKDIMAGYSDRMAGYYDKWYRYNHSDSGRAYDIGVNEAAKQAGCKDDFTIIECAY